MRAQAVYGVFLVAVIGTYEIYNFIEVSSPIQQPEDLSSVLTAQGRLTYAAIENRVYQPLGYKIVGYSFPFAKLELLDPPTCTQVFQDWQNRTRSFVPEAVPPRQMPNEMVTDYLLQGHSFYKKDYRNDKHNSGEKLKPFEWTAEMIESWKRQAPETFATYGAEGSLFDRVERVLLVTVHSALRFFGDDIRGKEGVVIGSIDPWVEVMALLAGASHVTTVEYQRINISHPNMSYVHPMELVEKFEDYIDRFDFAVSFSSLEHSGLGRYGDPLDPMGDIREVQKTGGLFFIGLPVGRDTVLWNIHRSYGRIRLPMMFEGFELLAAFQARGKEPVPLLVQRFEISKQPHLLFVLRKM